MLYGEFVEGTGCRETQHNYEVYKRVEMFYMMDESMTKEEAYDIGKMWVDNSLTDEEISHNNEVYAEIEEWEDSIRRHKDRIADIQDSIRELKDSLKWEKACLQNCITNKESARLKLITV